MRFPFLVAVLVLAGGSPARAADALDLSKTIDARIAAAHKTAGITPVPRAEPHELLRRIYLDVLGRIPTPEEATAYLKDPDPAKHHKLIDELLTHLEMPVYWRGVFHYWLNGTLDEKRPGEAEFLDYARAGVNTDEFDRLIGLAGATDKEAATDDGGTREAAERSKLPED